MEMQNLVRRLVVVILLLAGGYTPVSAEILEKPALIESPVDWALGYFLISHGDSTHIARSQLDLDHDGVDELFLGWPAAGGRNGMPFVVFRQSNSGYLFLGELFARKDLRLFKVLPLSENNQIRFAQYWAHGGCEGTIAISTHDGARFKVVSTEKVCAGDAGTDEDNKRLKEVFGE